MKTIRRIFAALGLALVLPGAANAATSDPEVIIYRFPGVRDDGGAADVGVATVFNCTNFSGAVENIRFVTRRFNGTLLVNNVFNIGHLGSVTVATHSNAAYGSQSLATGAVEGTTAIAATSTSMVCTAMTIDAANPKPDGVALHGVRFSPIPGTEE